VLRELKHSIKEKYSTSRLEVETYG
jgi:hypothetical protein